MSFEYKINVLDALKQKGYNTNRLRKEKILGEAIIQKLRRNDTSLSLQTVDKICELLECQPSDILEYINDN